MEATETNNESFESSKTGLSFEYKLWPMKLEQQKLQLCAKHAVNNLLQLDSTKNVEEESEKHMLIVCHGKIWKILKQEIFNPCTKKELDLIADEMTFKENELYTTNESQVEDIGTEAYYSKLSYWQILRSSHRTPITGNYSYEVLEAALSRRNIELEWFTQIDSLTKTNFCYNLDNETVTIGFIVNSIEALSLTNAVTRLLSTPRHWFAITAIRHIQSDKKAGFIDDLSLSSWMDNEEVKSSSTWHLVDSEMNAIETMTSEKLIQMLSEVLSNKGSIFRCVLKGASSVNERKEKCKVRFSLGSAI